MNVLISRLLLFFILFKPGVLSAQSATRPANDPPGILFFKGSWKDALAEAKRQNKPIFLDVYTSWCPPCKRMATEAFPNPKVGATFNVHFINYQLDAEKGEGIQLARQYAVASYPTALYIAPDGSLAYRAVGYSGINGMINQADHMLDLPQLRPTLAKGDNDFVEGKRDLNFLRKYLKTRQSLNRPVHDVLDAYIDAIPDYERTTNETLIFVTETLEASDKQAARSRRHDYLNTYARLLQKLGRHDEAIDIQQEAIREAEKAGWDTTSYERELAAMKVK